MLDGSDMALCLDTGHLLIGGTDPAELTRQAPERIAHTHLKDVNDSIAAKVRSGRLTYSEAVKAGMYRPLGTGDVNVESILKTLRENDYQGWYTLEQDTILTEEPTGVGPVRDVAISADYVREPARLIRAGSHRPVGQHPTGPAPVDDVEPTDGNRFPSPMFDEGDPCPNCSLPVGPMPGPRCRSTAST